MKRLSMKFIVNALVFFGVNLMSNGRVFSSYWSILWAAALLVLLNLTIRPILKLFSLPLTFLTFGLFGFIISAVVISIVDVLVAGVHFQNFWQMLMTAVLIAVVEAVVRDKRLD